MGLIERRPRGLLRVLLRGPILAYRAGFGWLFGHRLVYLVHRGRKSGKRRETVLEVVGYDGGKPEVVVVSGWGHGSDWYRNISAAPALEIRIGTQRWHNPRQRTLTVDQTVEVLRAYQARHPRAWHRIAPMLGIPLDPGAPAALDQLDHVPAVAFSPGPDRGPAT